MSSSIILRSPGGVDDKRLGLANSQFARQLSIGNTWNRIRIAIRFSMVDPEASLAGTPAFAMGMCSGTTNLYGDATTTNFVGALSIASEWTRVAGSPPYLYLGNGGAPGWCPASKTGTTLVQGSGFFYGPQAPVGVDYRTMLAVDITKGSPNYTVGFWCKNNGTAYQDYSQSTLLASQGGAEPSHANYTILTGPVAASESAGNLDTICLHWSRTTPIFEISDLLVVRVS